MYSLGGGRLATPLGKALENRYRVEMHVHSPIFKGQLIVKQLKSITFIVWVLGRVEKMPKKGQKNEEKKFSLFQTNMKV